MSKRNKFGESKMTQDNQSLQGQVASATAEQENNLAAEQSTQEPQAGVGQTQEESPAAQTQEPEVQTKLPEPTVQVTHTTPAIVAAPAGEVTNSVFEGVKISAALEKTLKRFKDNADAMAVAKDIFAFVARNKAGVPQTEESCTSACKQLLGKISLIYRDAENFNAKYSVLVAVAREFDDECFTPTLMFRGAPGLSEGDYRKHEAAVTLLIESAHLADARQAAKRLDITKMLAAFGNSDITNRVLAWYE